MRSLEDGILYRAMHLLSTTNIQSKEFEYLTNVAGLFRDTWSDVFWESRKGPGTSDHCRGKSAPSCANAPGDTGLSAAGLRPAMIPSFAFPTCCWKIPWSGTFRSLSVNMKVGSSVAFWLTGSSFYSVTMRADRCPLWCHPSNPCDSTTDAFSPCLPPPGGSLTLSLAFVFKSAKEGQKEGEDTVKELRRHSHAVTAPHSGAGENSDTLTN